MPSISLPVATIAAGALSAGAGVVGGAMQSGAAGKGAGQSQALAAQQRNDLMPWVNTGGTANTASADLLGLNGPDAATAAMANYRTSPGYQFQLSEGLRGVDAGAAAKGMLRSGATLKAEQAFGAGLADSDFQKYFENLMGISKIGETAAAGGAYTAANAGNQAQQAGNTQASIYSNTGKILTDTTNSLLSNKDVTGYLFGKPTPKDPFGALGDSYEQYGYR